MDSCTTSNTPNGTVPGTKARYGKPFPPSWIPLSQKPFGTPTRRLQIVTIGAAVAGMGFAYKLQHEHKLTAEGVDGMEGPLVEHTIYEANKDIGGTWLVNTYPGVACDVPAHVYAFPFEVGLPFSSLISLLLGQRPYYLLSKANAWGDLQSFFSLTLPGARFMLAATRY